MVQARAVSQPGGNLSRMHGNHSTEPDHTCLPLLGPCAISGAEPRAMTLAEATRMRGNVCQRTETLFASV